MKLLLDEHLPPTIAANLRDRGHDVAAIAESERWVGSDEDAVVRRATAEQRAIVTNNVRDFRPLAAELIAGGAHHPGLILIPANYRRTKADAGRIVLALDRLLREHTDDALEDRETWL